MMVGGIVTLTKASISPICIPLESIYLTPPWWNVNLGAIILGPIRLRATMGSIHVGTFLFCSLVPSNRFIIPNYRCEVFNH